jgi:hypothetical protein
MFMRDMRKTRTRQGLLEGHVGIDVIEGTEIAELLGDLVVFVVLVVIFPDLRLFGFFSEARPLGM